MAKRCFGCMQMKENDPICEHCGYDENSQNTDHQLPVRTVLGGQYLIGKALGQGGFGITYLAWDQVMNQPVAVKEYFPKGFASRAVGNTKVTSYDGQNAHDFEFNKKRFLREAESLAKLWNIPQIVKILRYFEENGTAYIVMEYVQGVDLRKHLKKLGRPLTVEETLSLLGPVAEGLGLVHKIDLVHRDISSDNIMVLPDGSTKLLDFGAARFVENANADQERLTSTQAILKHGFAPPEQYRSHGALGPWTDVYALCATMYYCLSGKVPTEAMARTIDGEPIDWNAARGLSSEQKAALEKGMALQAKNRLSSVEELWKQLKPVVPETKPIPTPTPQPKPEPPKKHWKKLVLCAIAALAVVIALCGLSGVNNHRKDTEPSVSVKETQPIETLSQETDSPVPLPEPNITCTFTKNSTGWTITGYEGDKANLPAIAILPSEKDGEPVTAIDSYAFQDCSRLNSVTVPKNVTAVGNYAFRYCNNMTNVTILEGVTSIGDSAFYGCSRLIGVTIPDSVTSIGDGVFLGCSNLTSIYIPDSVTSIGNSVFSYCSSLSSVTISDSVTSIGDGVFLGCSNLTRISIPDSVTSIGNSAFSYCCSLTSVIIPDSVTSIGKSAFQNCDNLTSVTISKDCIVGTEAFPDSCTVIRR